MMLDIHDDPNQVFEKDTANFAVLDDFLGQSQSPSTFYNPFHHRT